MLEVRRVFHYYGKARALEEVSLTVERGSLHSVIGPNGAGKSTLLRAISGLEKIDRGTITFKEKRIDGLSANKIAKLGIMHCPERRRLFPDMTVLENLEMGATTLKGRGQYQDMLDRAFTIFPRLKERKKQRSGTLSGGEQQMLAIARGLMANPELYIMDEPSLGLAPRLKEEIFSAITSIKDEGMTILLVEQDAMLAMRVSDYIYVLEEGKIEMRGTRKELEREPRIKEVYLGISC